jgi:hypothetical protein
MDRAVRDLKAQYPGKVFGRVYELCDIPNDS